MTAGLQGSLSSSGVETSPVASEQSHDVERQQVGVHSVEPEPPPVPHSVTADGDEFKVEERQPSAAARLGPVNAFPEFDLTQQEVIDLELRLHSTDESFGTLNAGKPTNPWSEVLLRVEIMPRTLVKLVYNSLKLAIFASFLSLILLLAAKLNDKNFGFYSRWFNWVQVGVSGPLTVIAFVTWIDFLTRIIIVYKRKLKWSTRRHRLSTENFLQVSAVLVINVFWLAPNIYLLADPCSWFSNTLGWFAFMRWSALFLNLGSFIMRAADLNVQTTIMQDGRKRDVMFLDKPLVMWIVFLALWAMPTAILLIRVIISTVGDSQTVTGMRGIDNTGDGMYDFYETYHMDEVLEFAQGNVSCYDLTYTCDGYNYSRWTLFAFTVFIPVYFIIYVALIIKAYLYLRSKSYSSHRMANMLEELTWRQNLSTFVLVLLSQILLGWIEYDSCGTRMISWASGLFPANLVLNGTILLPALLFMPVVPSDKSVDKYRDQLAQGAYVWSEREKPRKQEALKRVASTLFTGKPEVANTTFCVETAIKCLYFNWCAYLHHEDESGCSDWGSMDIVTALSLYGLTNYDVIHEPSTSSKCLLAWSNSHIVLAFRGTVDLTGCFQNLKVWYAVHTPKRVVERQGRLFVLPVPMVHKGFHRCWTAAGFHERVLASVRQIVCMQGDGTGTGVRVTVTGHSLGAAMAVMCCWDLKHEMQFEHIQCYTYGCPHIGNAAFQVDFNTVLPDCHNIVNSQDAVVRSGKFSSFFIRLMERPGRKVLVNKKGDMLVHPTPMEAYLKLLPGIARWSDHVLSSYDEVMIAVLRAQFTEFGLQRGLIGALSIFQNTALRRYYASRGLDVFQEVHLLMQGPQGPRMPTSFSGRISFMANMATLAVRRSATKVRGRAKDQQAEQEEGSRRRSAQSPTRQPRSPRSQDAVRLSIGQGIGQGGRSGLLTRGSLQNGNPQRAASLESGLP